MEPGIVDGTVGCVFGVLRFDVGLMLFGDCRSVPGGLMGVEEIPIFEDVSLVGEVIGAGIGADMSLLEVGVDEWSVSLLFGDPDGIYLVRGGVLDESEEGMSLLFDNCEILFFEVCELLVPRLDGVVATETFGGRVDVFIKFEMLSSVFGEFVGILELEEVPGAISVVLSLLGNIVLVLEICGE